MKYSKLQVAEKQLETALHLFFSEAHPIPIETLCGAVIGVLRPIGKKFGVLSPLHDSDWIKDEYKKYWIDILHQAQNFSKHSDKDTEAVLNYDPAVVPLRIAEASYLYKMLSHPTRLNFKLKTFVIVFDLWFSLKYPQLIKQDNTKWQAILEEFKLIDPDPNDMKFFLGLLERQT